MSSGFPSFDGAIGLLGGAFDPPHLGHEKLAQEILERFQLRELRFLPNNGTAQKAPRASSTARLECLKILAKRDPRLGIEDYELKNRPPHSTHATLSALGQTTGLDPARTVFFMGTDQWTKWESWKRFPEVLELANWGIFLRHGISIDAVNEAKARYLASGILTQTGETQFKTRTGRQVSWIETKAPELSSTEIRESFALTGRAPSGRLNPGVEAYLMENHVYGK